MKDHESREVNQHLAKEITILAPMFIKGSKEGSFVQGCSDPLYTLILKNQNRAYCHPPGVYSIILTGEELQTIIMADSCGVSVKKLQLPPYSVCLLHGRWAHKGWPDNIIHILLLVEGSLGDNLVLPFGDFGPLTKQWGCISWPVHCQICFSASVDDVCTSCKRSRTGDY